MLQLKKTFDTDGFNTYIQQCMANEQSLLESVLDYSERNGIDVQTMADILRKNPKYKKLLLAEAESLRLVK
jgi:hypothetical protein